MSLMTDENDIVYLNEDEVCLDKTVNGDITILSLNIRGLTNKLSLLELSETFLKASQVEFYNIDGYNAFHYTRENRSGGGIVFYVRESIIVDDNIQKNSSRSSISDHQT
jgi:hypothetical protein